MVVGCTKLRVEGFELNKIAYMLRSRPEVKFCHFKTLAASRLEVTETEIPAGKVLKYVKSCIMYMYITLHFKSNSSHLGVFTGVPASDTFTNLVIKINI